MDISAHMTIFGVLVGIPVVLAMRYQRRHDGTTKAGVVVVGAALVGMVASAIALHFYDGWRERKRREDVLLHLTDPLCHSTGGNEQLRVLRELGCGEGRTLAVLEAPRIDVNRHDALAGVMIPPSDKPYVVWFVDAAGAPLAHLALEGGSSISYVRDPAIARATGVQLTAEPAPGNAPAAPVIASAPFAPL